MTDRKKFPQPKLVPEHLRNLAVKKDRLDFRVNPQYDSPDSREAEITVAVYVHEVEEFLRVSNGRVTKQQCDILLQKLDNAILINNDPTAKELRIEVERLRSAFE